jgi:hypothetical protein
MYGDFVVAANPAIDGMSGFTAGYDLDNRGWFSWDNEEKEFRIGVKSNGTTTAHSIYLSNGNVGIGNSSPGAPLSVGNSLGSFSTGKFITVGDYTADGFAGLFFGQNSDNRGYLGFSNVTGSIFMGMEPGIMDYSSHFAFKDGNASIGTSVHDTIDLYVKSTYFLPNDGETRVGVFSSQFNQIQAGHVTGGRFEVTGGTGAYGVFSEVTGGDIHSVAGVFDGDKKGIEAYGGKYAGQFLSYVSVWDSLSVFGHLDKTSGSFKIDHPLDPENKFLLHSFVESPDMMNIYNGNVVTGSDGLAEVTLPEYFEALNMEFRYQLTVIGEFAQAIIKEEVSGNRFSIMTDKPNVKVSWMVTGIRQDPWANDHRIQVEVEKPDDQKGYYVAPESYGFGKDRRIGYPNSALQERINASTSDK